MNRFLKLGIVSVLLLSISLALFLRNGRSDEITSPTGTDRDLFGKIFEIDNDLMVVGAGRDGERAKGGGAIHLFQKNNNQWQETAKLFPIVSTPFQYFALSIAHAEDRIAASGCSDRGIFEAGVVFILHQQGSLWREVQQIRTTSCINRNSVLAMQEDKLAIGLLSSRQILVYRWNGELFVEEATLTPRETRIYSITDQYARLKMVAMDNDRIVMSLEDGAGVYVFKYEDGEWVEEQKLTVLESSFSYGASIDIQNNQIIVGDPLGWTCQNADCVIGGTVYLFEWNGTSWEEVEKLQAKQPIADSWFGNSVELDRNSIVVGAPLEIAGSFGAAYQFEKCGDEWQQQARFFAGLNPRTEYAISRGWKSLSENVRSGAFEFDEVVTAVQGGYQHPLQIGIGPDIEIEDEFIYVGPTRSNINNERIIYQFPRESC